MTDGCYDIEGKCVNCGRYHPCDCENQVVEFGDDFLAMENGIKKRDMLQGEN